MQVGDRIKARITYGMEGGTLLPSEEGTVVYIHPEGRFYTLQFTFPRGSFRESYWTCPPEKKLSERPAQQIMKGWHNNQNGALGKYLETM